MRMWLSGALWLVYLYRMTIMTIITDRTADRHDSHHKVSPRLASPEVSSVCLLITSLHALYWTPFRVNL